MRRTAPSPGDGMMQARTSDRSLGLFLMALWSVAILLYTWDMATAPTWDGLAGVHAVMQSILLIAALGTGATGAALWIGKPAPPPAKGRHSSEPF